MDLKELRERILTHVDKYRYDLAYTAPELFGMRIAELKSKLAGEFDALIEAQEESGGEEVSG